MKRKPVVKQLNRIDLGWRYDGVVDWTEGYNPSVREYDGSSHISLNVHPRLSEVHRWTNRDEGRRVRMTLGIGYGSAFPGSPRGGFQKTYQWLTKIGGKWKRTKCPPRYRGLF